MTRRIRARLWLVHQLLWTVGISCFLCLVTMSHLAYGTPLLQDAGTPGPQQQATTVGKKGLDQTKEKAKSPNPGQTKPSKAAPASGSVQYADLVAPVGGQKPKLPYGEPFTIVGKLADVCVVGKAQRDASTNGIKCQSDDGKGQAVSDILATLTVGGKFVVLGQETPFTAPQVSGDSWSVVVGKLDENSPVTFRFTFSGKLNQSQADTIANQLLTSSDFASALDQFLAAATGKKADEQAVLASALGKTTAEKVMTLVAGLHVTATNPDDFRKRLSDLSPSAFGLFINVPAELDELRSIRDTGAKQQLGFDDKMTPSAAYESISQKLKADAIKDPALKVTAQRFTGAYGALRNELAINVAADLSVDVGTTADDVTEDLKKYAGFDVGALYIPRLHELREFATVNIYFGSVSLQPSNGTRSFFLERLSLTFGMALGDMSGGDSAKTKIKGENAFAYGIGFRLNKYFRIATGGVVYRTQLPAVNGVTSPITNKLRHEFFVGPSIDVTAIPALKSIFAKAKSN